MTMTPGRIEPNTTVRIPGEFFDNDGTAVDPTTVTFTVRTPSGVNTTYTYNTDDAIERESAGVYNADFDVNTEAGRWYWRWEVGDGFVTAARSGSFVVQSDPIFDDAYERYR